MENHQGIRIDRIPADGVGGLIFAAGMVVLFWLAVPAFRPIVIGSVLAGAVLSRLLDRHRL